MPPADATGPDSAQRAGADAQGDAVQPAGAGARSDAVQPAGDGARSGARPADATGLDAAHQEGLKAYARAAALLLGLEIDDAWWPAVFRHLDVLIQRAASLEDGGFALPDDPAPVFHP